LKRKLLNNKEVEELESPIALIIWTKCPQKWKIEDLETGQIYIGDKENNNLYGEVLKNAVKNGNFGQWKIL
jgi:hypothetical protein